MPVSHTPAGATPLEGEGNGPEPPGPVDEVTLFLAGDVMTGRGIDQILPYPGDPVLYERYVASADDYLSLAEAANGPIPRPVDFPYIWGDALAALARHRPAVRLVNLETAVTGSAEPVPKDINYRMHPRNVPVLTAAGIDCCSLANNHVLDWGRRGLAETLDTLVAAGIGTVGAGRTAAEAATPAVVPVAGGRIVVFAYGALDSGVPPDWAATADRPGVNFLPDLSERSVSAIATLVKTHKAARDVVVISLHWGGNWGYAVPRARIAFARALIDRAGADIVFGHSAHHPQAIEVHAGKLILYGCGDLIDDYEGIGGHESYRGDLVLLYLPKVRLSDGMLVALTIVPMRIRRMRLNRAAPSDADWLAETLTREGERFGTGIRRAPDGTLALDWAQGPKHGTICGDRS